jgi:phosphoglycolate phosphatase
MVIIFDNDGTLFDMSSIVDKAFSETLKNIGEPEHTKAFIRSQIGAPIKKIALNLVSDKSKVDDFLKWSLKCEIEQIEKTGRLYPDVLEMLKRLKQAGHTLALCSNGRQAYMAPIIDKFKTRQYFDIVWHKHYGVSKKRAAKIINKKLNRGEKTIFIGDRKEDIEAGNDNGFISIGCTYGFGKKSEFEDADYIANDVNMVSNTILRLGE